MSIIAVKRYEDHVKIASDSQITFGVGNRKNKPGFKLFPYEHGVMGLVGDASAKTFLDLYKEEEEMPELTIQSVSEFLVKFWQFVDINKSVSTEITSCSFVFANNETAIIGEDYFVIEVDDCYAIGAGEELAEYLMKAGKTPKHAVEKVCEFSIYCSAPVETYTIFEEEVGHNVST